ncbi:unnamed protein product [Rotaria sordida]|uniref:Uncharacterized protein n=1 Tax=Rotaria sordida TaxID=392033 RepID=A0A816FV81_9BILA|nr:unnamed protein product [Rotaria sordida]CAF1666242.1 unnamed protein product [Rotaria sordida]
MQFDDEIVRTHDELLDQIQKLEKSNILPSDLFDQIEQWKKTTIDKVEKAAERARHQLVELTDKQRSSITKQFEPITKEIRFRREEEDFLEKDIDRLKQKLNEIKQKLQQFTQKDTAKTIIVDNDQIDWNRIIHVREEQKYSSFLLSINLNTNSKWLQNGVTVAGGNGVGNQTNQLNNLWGLCIGDDQTIYVADCGNKRIVEWKYGATTGQVVAGGNGSGNQFDQLASATDVIVDKSKNSLIICDYSNNRVVRWSRSNGRNGETVIRNIGCWSLTMDDDEFLYVSDYDRHEVRRYGVGETQGTLVAGGNGSGNRLDQLSYPGYVFVDEDHSVYISEYSNHRVVKWMKDAKEGIVVAGGQGQGNNLSQLSGPYGIAVDKSGTVYVADSENNRIVRWRQGATQGDVIIGGNGRGNQSNQLYDPMGLSFDREGNLYVNDNGNSRVQKFNIDRS